MATGSSAQDSSGTSGTPDGPTSPWSARVKLVLFAGVLLALGILVGLAVLRESTVPARMASDRPVLPAPRPALSSAEEVYARALWSIHGDVKGDTFRLTLVGMK